MKRWSEQKSTYKNSSVFNYLIKCILCAIKSSVNINQTHTYTDSDRLYFAIIVCVLFSTLLRCHSIVHRNFFYRSLHWSLSLHLFMSMCIQPLLCVCCFFVFPSLSFVCCCSCWIYQPRLKINYSLAQFCL